MAYVPKPKKSISISLKTFHDYLRKNPDKTISEICKDLGITQRNADSLCNLFVYKSPIVVAPKRIVTPIKLKKIDPEDIHRLHSPYASYYDEINLKELKKKFKGTHTLTLRYVKDMFAMGSLSAIANHLLLNDDRLKSTLLTRTGMENIDEFIVLSEEEFLEKFADKADEIFNFKKGFKEKIDNQSTTVNLNNNFSSSNVKQLTLLEIHAYIQVLKDLQCGINLTNMCNYFKFNGMEEFNRHINQFIFNNEIVSLQMLITHSPEDEEFTSNIIGYFDPIDITTIAIDSYPFEIIHTFCSLNYLSNNAIDRIHAIENCLRLERNTLKFDIESLEMNFEGFQIFCMEHLQEFANFTFGEFKNEMNKRKSLAVSSSVMQPPSAIPSSSLRILPLMNSTVGIVRSLGASIESEVGSSNENYTYPIGKRKNDVSELAKNKRQKNATGNSIGIDNSEQRLPEPSL